MAGIRDQQFLDDVGMVMRRLLKRVQADDTPAVTEASVGEADDVRRGFLEFRCVANANVERRVEQECPRRPCILGLSGSGNHRRRGRDRQISQFGTNRLHHFLSSHVVRRPFSVRYFFRIRLMLPRSSVLSSAPTRQSCVETSILSLSLPAPVSTSNPFETTSSARMRPSMIFAIGSLPNSTNPMIRGQIVIG